MKGKNKHLITICLLVIILLIGLSTHYYPRIALIIASIIFIGGFYWFIYRGILAITQED
jgi:hypothetical protein